MCGYLDDYQTMGKKVLCGGFAQCLNNNFAVGDEENNLILYNVLTPKPISVLTTGTNNNNPSALTALAFTPNDDQIIVGSSRGSINVWDLSTLRSNSPSTQSTPPSRDTPSKSPLWPATRRLITC